MTGYHDKVMNHLNLWQVINALTMFPSKALLFAGQQGYYPELKLRPYRGYPEDVEVGVTVNPVTVGEFLNLLLEAKDTVLTAYNGDECLIMDECRMWMGYEGGLCGKGINGIHINGDGTYTLVTGMESGWHQK